MDFTREYDGFIEVNDSVKVVRAIIKEVSLVRCKNVYDGVTVEEINILESITKDEEMNRLRLYKRKDLNRLILKLTDEQAFEILL